MGTASFSINYVTINTQFSLKPTKMQLTLKFVLFGALVALANAVTCPVCGALYQQPVVLMQPDQCNYEFVHANINPPAAIVLAAGGSAANAGADGPQNVDADS